MKREAKELNNLIEQVSQKVVDKVVNEKYLVSRMAVIVNEFDPNTNSASIIIPTDLSNHTDYKYPNRTGMTSLRSTVWENGQIKTYGDKVYLVYQSNNISQGWLESNKSLDIVKEVSRDYLTKVEAANTYETKADANSKYVKKTGDTMTGALNVDSYIQTNGSGANSRIVAQDSVHNGQVRLQFVNNHTQHGVYSMGYSTDGTTWTSDGRWIICRDAENNVLIHGSNLKVKANGTIEVASGIATGNNINVQARGANARVRATDTTHMGEIRLTWGNNHQTHGLLSTGYSTDGATLTSANSWLIYRNASNTVQLNDGKVGIDGSGNLVANGNVNANGGQVISGTSTLSSRDTYIVCKSIAGDIFFKCGTSATANKWICVKNNAGTYKDILAVDQSNNVIFQTGFSVSGAVWLSGNLTADGGDIHAGNTSKARTANNGVHSVAGKIYLHTEATNTGKRGLWVSNRNDTYKEIISVDQNNVATFNGHTTRSAIWTKGSGSHSIAVSATGIPAKVQVKQVGSDFTISNGNVICGRAGTVRVTCKLFVWSNVVNGGGMTAWIRVSGTNNTDTQTTMSPFTNGVMYLEGIFTVSANTAINYQIRNDSGSATLSHQATSSMIVEYLD